MLPFSTELHDFDNTLTVRGVSGHLSIERMQTGHPSTCETMAPLTAMHAQPSK